MHSHDDELLVLAQAIGELKTKTEKIEAEFSTQARPLEAATNALSATLAGLKALQFHVIDNNLGAVSARVEEMRKAVDEQVNVVSLELKKSDESNAAKAAKDAEALRLDISGLESKMTLLSAYVVSALRNTAQEQETLRQSVENLSKLIPSDKP